MLDSETKRRIDTARQILVGKVPDPKSQVEQITIALIYKFMDDMDAESEEFGGKRKFFAKDFARYGWAKLMRSGLGGHETLNLYAEAIERMPENPGIPPLFRDIFKNAYLPYRDPETLRMFLKVIDEFTYDHSERLGDAFEYLLSVLGSQGDAGQFRTPRHIIDFMVAFVDPKKTETVLDPACGTAGFLISSYKHILKANADKKGHSTLTPDEKGRLAQNFTGYDISPDMVRLSLVNLYLHGFPAPHIYEYDTLTSQDRWNEYADVILANPPFMSPKGGIKPHNRFGVQSKRSEVLFVDYMAEHLTPNGRAAIIVPEGIIFQSQTAYKQLRKMLVENSLVAVISLPAGCFNPYSGVKTSILFLDKSLAKRTDKIAFLKVENDGFDLGAQRRPIDKNDLPDAADFCHAWLQAIRTGKPTPEAPNALVVEKNKISKNGEYNLSGERYREGVASTTEHKLEPVSRFMRDDVKTLDPRNFPDELFELWSIPAFDAGQPELLRGSEIGSQKKVVGPGDVLLSRIIPHIRRCWVVEPNSDGRRQVASTEWIVFSSDRVLSKYLQKLLISDRFHTSFMQTITGVGGSLSRANPHAVGEIQIPLPPLAVQKEIVAEIEGYQKVIDGARAVVDHYRPHIPIRPEWPLVQIGDLVDSIILGLVRNKAQQDPRHIHPYVKMNNITNEGGLDLTDLAYVEASKEEVKRLSLNDGDFIYNTRNSPELVGKSAVYHGKSGTHLYNNNILRIRFGPRALPDFVNTVMNSDYGKAKIRAQVDGTTSVAALYQKNYLAIEIPLPPITRQREIMAEIEAEQALVNANRELLARMEKKIQAVLARVWGE